MAPRRECPWCHLWYEQMRQHALVCPSGPAGPSLDPPEPPARDTHFDMAPMPPGAWPTPPPKKR